MPFFVVVSKYRDATGANITQGESAGTADATGVFESRAAALEAADQLKLLVASEWPWTVVDVIEAKNASMARLAGFGRWLHHPDREDAIKKLRSDSKVDRGS